MAATPLLEESELARHRPVVASALAGCYVKLGELLKASELYHAIAEEEPQRGWTYMDRAAAKGAKKKAEEVDARIPTITLSIEEAYDDLDVLIDGKSWVDPLEPKKVAPDTTVDIEIQARDTDVFTAKLVLSEGERRILPIKLHRKPKPPPPRKDQRSTNWIGARFRGYMMPKFVINAVFDGGATIFAPGGGLTFETRSGDASFVFSAAYASYAFPEMPLKKIGTPDTDYEIDDSDLMALFATLDVLYNKGLDDAGRWTFRAGVSVGVGWMFWGNLYRTQAYPTKQSGNDPYLYAKCKGPNNPFGTFRYCNELDIDKTRYPGYTEPSWFDGGRLPTVFPFLAVPLLGIGWTPTNHFGMDLQVAPSISGLMVDLGFRIGL
ncbi:MAG: hypothetical protein U0441_29500 [Polyangiaceae bacterium]